MLHLIIDFSTYDNYCLYTFLLHFLSSVLFYFISMYFHVSISLLSQVPWALSFARRKGLLVLCGQFLSILLLTYISQKKCSAACSKDCPYLDHFALLRPVDQPFEKLRLGRLLAARTARPLDATPRAEVAALKVASQGEAKSQLVNEAQFLLGLQHEGIVRARGIYQVKMEGRKQCWD